MSKADDSLHRRPDLRAARPVPSLQGLTEMAARDRAYHDLRYRILMGRLAPGTTLLETELAGLLNLSRTPVREAVIKLAEEGLVEVRPRHGVTVKPLTVKDVADILDIFSALEVRAVELVARISLPATELRQLERLASDMERETDRGDIAAWSELDDEFHAHIVALCGNDRLQEALGACWGQQYRARLCIVPLRPSPVQSDLEHRGILEALKLGDSALARLRHQQHRDRADAQQLHLLKSHLGTNGMA